MKPFTEWQRRLGIGFVAFLLYVPGGAYLFLSDARRWNPQLTGWLFAAAATCTLIVALRPHTNIAYRLAGALTMTALTARIIAIGVGGWSAFGDLDAILITISAGSATALIMFLWWVVWLHQIKAWHEGHLRAAQVRRGVNGGS